MKTLSCIYNCEEAGKRFLALQFRLILDSTRSILPDIMEKQMIWRQPLNKTNQGYSHEYHRALS
jgi:hypothetical protein